MKFHGTDYYFHKKKKMAIINSKVRTILPELINRNKKLVDRLRDKLKVSSFFNNIEKRNKLYLQTFISSSNKRKRDLKTGIQIDNVIKQNSEIMSILCDKMDDDILIKNFDKLKKEKQLVCEKTEEETHNKIDELLFNLKSIIKKPKKLKKELKIISNDNINNNKKNKKDINGIMEYIGNKIKNEEKNTDNKIADYLKKLNYIFKTYGCNEKKSEIEETENEEDKSNYYKRKKEIKKLSENFYIKNDLKLINYTKPKPFQIKDKESANMQRIKDCFYPSLIRNLTNKNKEKEILNQSDSAMQTQTVLFNQNNSLIKTDINNNSPICSINNNLSSKRKERNKLIDTSENINTNKKDSLEVLNMLSTQSKFLSQRFQKKSKKINSLIDIHLPNLKIYESLIDYLKKNNNNSESLSDVNIKESHLSKNIKQKLVAIKEDIKNKKFDFKIFNSIFNSYIKFNTTKNNKNKLIKLRKNLNIKKFLNHKESMENIQPKKIESVFITLDKLKDPGINNKLRKARSSDSKIKCNFS